MASNRLLSATVDQLNAFAATCESKLLALHHKVRRRAEYGSHWPFHMYSVMPTPLSLSEQMQRLETEVKLLESKLNSLPQCAADAPPQQPPIAGPPTPTHATSGGASAAEPASTTGGVTPDAAPATAPTAPPEPEPEAEPTLKVKDDQRFIKYFKMLAFGVPMPVVAAALKTETGQEASLLDNPNAPAPPPSEEEEA